MHDETDPTRVPDYTTTYYLSSTEYANLKSSAEGTIASGTSDYFVVFSNCVDFVHKTLNEAGIAHDLSDMFHGSKLNAYAEVLDFLVVDFPSLQDQITYYYDSTLANTIDYFMNLWDNFTSYYSDWYWEGTYGDYVVSAYVEEFEENEDWIYESPHSPMVIDLNGDGIHTTRFTFASNDGTVFFDIDGNGTVDRTAWLTGEDAFLVRDLNSDGLVNNGLEMFGGANRGDGYAELAMLDSNADGILNLNDTSFSSLMLWRDANANGTTETGELINAQEAGLTEIDLDYVTSNARDRGNIIGETSVSLVDGVERTAADVYFRVDLEYVV